MSKDILTSKNREEIRRIIRIQNPGISAETADLIEGYVVKYAREDEWDKLAQYGAAYAQAYHNVMNDPRTFMKSPEELADAKMKRDAEMARGDPWKYDEIPLPFDLDDPIGDRIEFPKEIEGQLYKSTGTRYTYKEPYDYRIHFSQAEREERRREYGVGQDPLKNNPAYRQYRIMWEMSHKVMLYYAGWMAIGKEVCQWFEEDLKDPTPVPEHIEDNITKRVSQYKTWRKREIENPELENELNEMFVNMPLTPRQKKRPPEPVPLDGVPMFEAPDGSSWLSGKKWWGQLSPAEKDHYRRQWQDGENDPRKWTPYQRDDEWHDS